jgi:biotin carboxylase
MKTGTALVLGSNAGQADLIRYLVDKGWRVVACGHRAAGPGKDLAHEFELVNIVDVDGVTALARRCKADLVYSVSSDVAVPTVVKVSQRLGLPYFFNESLVELFNNKQLLRRHLNDHGLSPVQFVEARSADDHRAWTLFPCIVKPADSQGQRGVRMIDDKAALAEAVAEAIRLSPSKVAIVEEYLDGPEISCNVLVSNGEVVIATISERLVHTGDLIGIPIGHLIPTATIAQHHLEEADGLVRAVVTSLGIQSGTLYFQMKVTRNGPKIVEIAPRLDGCHIWRLMALSCGLDYLDLSVRCLLGESIPRSDGTPTAPGIFELMFQQMPPGRPFSQKEFPVPADALYHEYRYADGQPVDPVNGRLEVVGYYVRRQ